MLLLIIFLTNIKFYFILSINLSNFERSPSIKKYIYNLISLLMICLFWVSFKIWIYLWINIAISRALWGFSSLPQCLFKNSSQALSRFSVFNFVSRSKSIGDSLLSSNSIVKVFRIVYIYYGLIFRTFSSSSNKPIFCKKHPSNFFLILYYFSSYSYDIVNYFGNSYIFKLDFEIIMFKKS